MVDRSGRHGPERHNVLLVDDGDYGFASHRRRLEARGYHVIKASDTEDALNVAQQAQPRIIFLTVEQLGSERTPFLVALRRDDRTRHIPVTVLPRGHDDSLERLGLSRVGRELW
jgi:response regulator RpfG family c-di-GMP phosphodiesterase